MANPADVADFIGRETLHPLQSIVSHDVLVQNCPNWPSCRCFFWKAWWRDAPRSFFGALSGLLVEVGEVRGVIHNAWPHLMCSPVRLFAVVFHLVVHFV